MLEMTRRFTGLNERPSASSPSVRHRMQATRRRDTPGEVALRSELHSRGLRYRVDRKPVPDSRRRADIVFRSARIAVFVDGCFWHACPQHATWPKVNEAWWRAKIDGNRQRDRDTDTLLVRRGWAVYRIWSHDDPKQAARKIEKAVRKRTATLDGRAQRRRN
jgi:DNA mismatch endonuclease (patch repair protein)